MRQRKKVAAPPTNESATKTVRRQLKKLDIFDKVQTEDQIQTSHGGVQTLLTYIVMSILFISELSAYLSTTTTEHVKVDPSAGGRLRINVNISFSSLNCREVSLVAMDVAGEHQLGIDHTIHKHRLDNKGRTIGERFKTSLGKAAHARENDDTWGGMDGKKLKPLPTNYCGSCYGAGNKGECCNTCDEVRSAYEGKGWNVDKLDQTSEQCQRENEGPAGAAKQGEGCNIEGFLNVNKVAGNIHVALGKSKSVNGRLIHQFSPGQLKHFDTSHRIHMLSFGEPFPGQTNSLDGIKKQIDRHLSQTGVYQYYVKIIPTQFTNGRGTITKSNQYSFTEKFVPVGEGIPEKVTTKATDDKNIQPHLAQGHLHRHASIIRALPGVFFIYDMSPFMILRTEESVGLPHFLVRICAVIGGVFTTSAIVSRFISFVVTGGKKRENPINMFK